MQGPRGEWDLTWPVRPDRRLLPTSCRQLRTAAAPRLPWVTRGGKSHRSRSQEWGPFNSGAVPASPELGGLGACQV